jgi:predicted amidohydrolase YtcJ
VRDPDTGEATGHLLEGAHFNLVWPKLADVDDTTRDVQIATALEAYASAGITSVVEMALEEPALLAMARAHYVRARLIGNQAE